MVSVGTIPLAFFSQQRLNENRWFAYDTICQLSFGEPLGFVEEGRDIGSLIENFHNMAPFAATVSALPWLARTFLENPITRRFAMPKPGDGTGTGKIMAVRNPIAILVPCITDDHLSSETAFSSNDSKIHSPSIAVTSLTISWRPKTPTGPQSQSKR